MVNSYLLSVISIYIQTISPEKAYPKLAVSIQYRGVDAADDCGP